MGFGKDGRGAILRVHSTTDVSALGAETALDLANLLPTMDFRVLKVELMAYAEGMNQGDHIYIGWADNTYTVAEVAECITNIGPLEPADTDEVEQSERRVELLGQMTYEAGAAQDAQLPRNGTPLVFNPRWTFRAGVGMKFFAFNPDSGVAISATTYVTIHAKLYGVWIR